MTVAQLAALRWLHRRNGTGLFDKTGVLLAAGERAEVMRSTWNKLRDDGFITIDRKRVNVTNAGKAEAMRV